ncbi:hypothetical protein Trydic_g15386 [Trypoxylus dichotomus]
MERGCETDNDKGASAKCNVKLRERIDFDCNHNLKVCFRIMVDLGGYVIILVETKDKKIKLYGSPADKDNLEVGDEILEVNGKTLEDATHTEVISHIHQCIRSRTICLRVKRRSGARLELSQLLHEVLWKTIHKISYEHSQHHFNAVTKKHVKKFEKLIPKKTNTQPELDICKTVIDLYTLQLSQEQSLETF